jgi:hypothetical protein
VVVRAARPVACDAVGGVLILVEANSATHGCDCVSFFVT